MLKYVEFSNRFVDISVKVFYFITVMKQEPDMICALKQHRTTLFSKHLSQAGVKLLSLLPNEIKLENI